MNHDLVVLVFCDNFAVTRGKTFDMLLVEFR